MNLNVISKGVFRPTPLSQTLSRPRVQPKGARWVRRAHVAVRAKLETASASDTKHQDSLPKTWYPIIVQGALDLGKPQAVRVLGHNLVAWRDPQGKVSVLEDKCAHRLVPLSEGHVDPKTGCLECPLHGYQFDTSGCNTLIPTEPGHQNKDKEEVKTNVKSFPVVETGDVVWAWMGDPDDPQATDPAIMPQQYLDHLNPDIMTKTFSRVLPIDQSIVLENFFDPAHIPFAHHGMQGTRDDAGPIPIGWVRPESEDKALGNADTAIPDDLVPVIEDVSQHLCLTFSDVTGGKRRSGTLNLKPPVSFWFETKSEPTEKFPEGRKSGLSLLCVPVQPGYTRVFINPLHAPRLSKFPAWLLHMFTNDFLDSDTLLLHQQGRNVLDADRTMTREGSNGAAKGPVALRHYKAGSQADESSVIFHNWFLKYHGATAPYSPSMPPLPDYYLSPIPLSREQILDRKAQHVDGCAECSKAHAMLEKVPLALSAATLVLAAFLRNHPIAVTLVVAAALLTWRTVSKWKGKLEFSDYVHAEKKAEKKPKKKLAITKIPDYTEVAAKKQFVATTLTYLTGVATLWWLRYYGYAILAKFM